MTDEDALAARTGPYVVHVTSDGDRWDQIANRYYGDPLRYEPIIAANGDLPIIPVLPASLHVLVPILTTATPSTDDLPPWKRPVTS